MAKIRSIYRFLEKAVTVAFALVVLFACFLITAPLERPVWEVLKSSQVEIDLESFETSLGQGLIVGIFGGLRTVLADLAWIQLYDIWLKKDWAELSKWIHLVTALDPRPEYFWIHASRMLAYDVPAWRIRDAGRHFESSPAWKASIEREQAEAAFTLLRRGLVFHPDSPRLHLEIGQIYMHRLKDYEEASKWFLKATKLPGAPYFAARIYAELLCQQGQLREALDYLKHHFFELEGAPAYEREILLERILYYEKLLDLPARLRFRSN